MAIKILTMKLFINNLSKIIFIFFRFMPITLFLSCMFYCLTVNFTEKEKYSHIQKNLIKVPVLFENKSPLKNNQSIKLAMALFSIDKNKNVIHPIYDPTLEYRGLTLGKVFSEKRLVYIGDSAFESWGLLGSTLAHEVEVHGKQSFIKIEFINFLYQVLINIRNYLFKYEHKIEYNNYGTYLAEREAYNYEIKNKNRFLLNQNEEKSLKAIRDNKLYLCDI
ncbi:hypothetical protein [Fluviispira multicolorata]|uniref:Uncharacterized protein n=1 Tax=Fluviispira multicolorata TaxID=2654512 RepID=A0A833JB80_9BACT|nr:hypothetical protein [Fluviispira multicolorata]KAB8029117.1 hypothetical protein GCL57_11295 [Fluviispira multicolorata]